MITTPSATFTRPANTTQYAANDLVANSATAGSVAPMEFGFSGRLGIVRRVRLFKDTEATTAASLTVHLFTSAPTVNNGDNGAFQPATVASHIAAVAIDMSSGGVASGTDLIKQSAETMICFALPALANRLYGLLEVEGTYTPASGEAFTVTLEIEGA